MTYCAAIRLKEGMVFASDTRTNAGVDHISTFRKLYQYGVEGERFMVLQTAGSLATSQAVFNKLQSDINLRSELSLNTVSSLFDGAQMVGECMRNVMANAQRVANDTNSGTFTSSFLLGGQIKGQPPELYMIYPEGNCIRATRDTPCQVCHGKRYDDETLAITYRDKNIAEVLNLTVEAAHEFFSDEAPILRALEALLQVGLGYLRLGQPATELSGGEAQRIKLATELQRTQRGDTLYILDEPTTGLHPADVSMLMAQLNGLVDAGNTVIMVEHDMQVASNSDWVMDMGPGAGDAGGSIVAQGTPEDVAQSKTSRTAPFLLV